MKEEATADLHATHALVRQFRLTILEGPGKNTTLESKGDRVVIGKDPGVDLVIADETVSRFHCEIVIAQGRPSVRDLGSRNGTLVDGVSVQAGWLHDGATITLGRSKLRFALGVDHVRLNVSDRERFGSLVGRSIAMRTAFALMERAARSDATVLMLGETGTGKELAAESIHHESPRSQAPFVVVDCAAIPPALLESELFGHERGAFTGATSQRDGAFESAEGGTIFLDEVGELPLDLQPKLLRVIERHQIKRVGANDYKPVDVRLIAATNRALRAEVNARRFRSDLYYRLAVLEIRLPPLRERPEDIPLLVAHLLQTMGAGSADLQTEDLIRDVASHPWPGNVRELRNYLQRCLALEQRAPITPLDADAPVIDASRPIEAARAEWVRFFERRYLEDLLAKHDQRVAPAAVSAGVNRGHLYRLLAKHGLRGR